MSRGTKGLIEIYLRTFDDKKISQGEKKALKQILKEENFDRQKTDLLRNQIFEIARSGIRSGEALEVVEWLEDANKILLSGQQSEERKIKNRVYFSPGDDPLNAIIQELKNVRSTLRICVFTITDNRISKEIIRCYQRGVSVRIITDNDKSGDLGSDIKDLVNAGIEVRMDDTTKHMHHKFAILDSREVLTGSYNWTRSAATQNEENILISNDPDVVEEYKKEFEKLWPKMVFYY